MDNETMVNDPTTEDTEDVGFQELVEEPAEEPSESLDSLLGDDAEDDGGDEEPKDEKPAQQRGTRSEPGYVQGRIAKAVQKAVAETEARLTAQFEKQLAPFREQALNAEAQELVRSGKVKDLETAKELVRYRQGQPQEQKQAQPREAQGQPQEDPATKARINMLQHQADRIKGNGGPDVIAAFKNNPEVKEKVITGEWDFEDVADFLKNGGGKKKRPPAPMRAPNGASGTTPNAIDTMSDEQFDRMEKNIKEKGARYSLR